MFEKEVGYKESSFISKRHLPVVAGPAAGDPAGDPAGAPAGAAAGAALGASSIGIMMVPSLLTAVRVPFKHSQAKKSMNFPLISLAPITTEAAK